MTRYFINPLAAKNEEFRLKNITLITKSKHLIKYKFNISFDINTLKVYKYLTTKYQTKLEEIPENTHNISRPKVKKLGSTILFEIRS